LLNIGDELIHLAQLASQLLDFLLHHVILLSHEHVLMLGIAQLLSQFEDLELELLL